ncbi:Protein trichome birefringence [Linum perenne]
MGVTDPTKHHLSQSPDFKSLLSPLKTKRSLPFVYGFMFAFVVFTVFLAFNPSPNSSSPWFFSNIFAATPPPPPSTDAAVVGADGENNPSLSSGSQFPALYSFLFPNNSSSFSTDDQPPETGSSVADAAARSGSDSSSSSSSSSESLHQGVEKVETSVNNQTQNGTDSFPLQQPESQVKNSSILNKETPSANQTARSLDDVPRLKSNQTSIDAPKPAVAANLTAATPVVSNATSGGAEKAQKKQSRGGVSGGGDGSKQRNETVKQGIEALVESLEGCDLFDGEWVMDDSYPLYKPGSCSFIDEQFNCILNGRPDKDYQKYKWKPHGCTLPRLNAVRLLDMLRGKRLVFVGDSLNRNMWESMVCMLKGAAKDQSKVYEVNGRQNFRGEASYSFIFKDYDCTVEFFVTPFLVQEWETKDKKGSAKETLRLDLIGQSSNQYKTADFIVFNTGHWWTHEKTSLGKDYYQEGSHVYPDLNVLEAFRKALTTWGRWVDSNVNPRKSMVFFRGYSASHFSQWNSGGACDNEVEPIKNSTYLTEYPDKMVVLEKVLRGMKTSVKYLNVTRMTDYRKDGHPSMYRKQKLSEEYQDCSHWCLPGVPDAWNEILYAQVLVNEYRKQHSVQKRHRL